MANQTTIMNGEGLTKKTLDAYVALGKQIYDHGHKERGLEVMASGMAAVGEYVCDRRPTTAAMMNPWSETALSFKPSPSWDLESEQWYASLKTNYGRYAKEYQTLINPLTKV